MNGGILDSNFKYIPAAETDLRKTFARIRRRIKDEEEQRARNQAEIAAKVAPIAKKAVAR